MRSARCSFSATGTCAVVLVTLPEEMPTTETIELARALTGELLLPIGKVVVNGVLPPLFSKEERATLLACGIEQRANLGGCGDRRRDRTRDARARASRELASIVARASREAGIPSAAVRRRRALVRRA
jgi:hypothetical protein